MPTPHGAVDVSWKVESQGLRMNVTLPAGTETVVAIPATEPAAVQVTGADGKPANAKSLGMQQGRAVYEMEPGSYEIISTHTGLAR